MCQSWRWTKTALLQHWCSFHGHTFVSQKLMSGVIWTRYMQEDDPRPFSLGNCRFKISQGPLVSVVRVLMWSASPEDAMPEPGYCVLVWGTMGWKVGTGKHGWKACWTQENSETNGQSGGSKVRRWGTILRSLLSHIKDSVVIQRGAEQ